MLERFLDRFRKAEPSPQVRIKRYAAQSGYVYEYYVDKVGAPVYLFYLSWNRRHWLPLEVEVPAEAVAQWEQSHDRPIRAQERYAAAKLGLFEHLDRAIPADLGERLVLTATQVEQLLEPLDL